MEEKQERYIVFFDTKDQIRYENREDLLHRLKNKSVFETDKIVDLNEGRIYKLVDWMRINLK